MRSWILRGAMAAICLGLVVVIAGLYFVSRPGAQMPAPVVAMLSDSSAGEPSPPVKAEPATPIEPLANDIILLLPTDPTESDHEGLLAREIARQAVLIAARDELGLRTRDASLREILPDINAQALGAVRVLVSNPDGRGTMSIDVRRGDRSIDEEFDVVIAPGSDRWRLSHLATEAEAASRTVLVETLKEFGFENQRPQNEAKPNLISDREPSSKLINRLDPISQFAVVRAWHAAIEADGETSDRLAGLVRGYANLGILIEHYWSPAQKAFRARSFLYAARLLHRTGETVDSLRVRGYARALAGMPAAALDDFKHADRLADEENSAPEWVTVLRAHALGDIGKLAELCDTADGSAQTLACLMRLENVDISENDQAIRQAAQGLLRTEPACTRGYRALTQWTMSMGTVLSVVRRAAPLSRLWLYEPLDAADLPVELESWSGHVNDLGEEAQFREELIDGLMAEARFRSDTGEPSLFVLGRMIEEEGFLQAMALFKTYDVKLASDTQGIYKKASRWYRHHPYRDQLRKYVPKGVDDGYTKGKVRRHRDKILSGLLPAMETLREYYVYIGMEAQEGIRSIERNCDPVVDDLLWRLDHAGSDEERQQLTWTLRRVNPHSAETARHLFLLNPERYQHRLDEWEEQFGSDTELLKAMAEYYYMTMQYEQAIRCLERAFEETPLKDTLEWIAYIYQIREDPQAYIDSYLRWLDYPSEGLSHANTRREIAYKYAEIGELQTAARYARQAARSYSYSNLHCAAKIEELLGNFEESESYNRALSLRYDTRAAEWFFWCRRTGRGDVETARRRADVQIDQLISLPRKQRWNGFEWLATIAALDGETETAFEKFSFCAEKTQQGRVALLAAMYADLLGKTEQRDQLLEQAINFSDGYQLVIVGLSRAFIADLAGDPIDPEEIKHWIKRSSVETGNATDALYLVGRFLLNRSREEEAIPFLARAAESPVAGRWMGVLAGAALVEIDARPDKRRSRLFDEEFDRIVRLHTESGKYILENPEWALPRLEQILEIMPDNLPAMVDRARALAYAGRKDQAVQAFGRALKIFPHSAVLLTQRGKAHCRAGNDEQALADFKAALATDPSLHVANVIHHEMVWHLAACPDPDFRDPAAALRHAQAIEPDEQTPQWKKQHVLAIALAAGGRFEEAIAKAEAAYKSANDQFRQSITSQLALFRDHEPYVRREGWWRDTPLPVEAPRSP